MDYYYNNTINTIDVAIAYEAMKFIRNAYAFINF